jgi:23S rRNA-/tRNA-specific pseudouridylate synthase
MHTSWHPSHGWVDNTLVNALLAHTGALPGDPLRAGLVHRLDRDTSGLLLIAKTEAALTTLGRAMRKRYIKREYRLIVKERGAKRAAAPRPGYRPRVRRAGPERAHAACFVVPQTVTGRRRDGGLSLLEAVIHRDQPTIAADPQPR